MKRLHIYGKITHLLFGNRDDLSSLKSFCVVRAYFGQLSLPVCVVDAGMPMTS